MVLFVGDASNTNENLNISVSDKQMIVKIDDPQAKTVPPTNVTQVIWKNRLSMEC